MKWIGSPNFDTNRTPIDEIFIHWIVGPLSSADAVFQKPDGTSAHYGIEDDEIHQYVKEEHVAYHAGVYSHNQRSIGIEHSAAPDRPASEKTYTTSGKLIAEIAKRYDIPLDRTHVRGHKEVRNTQCPGTMDIDRLIKIAQEFTQDAKPTVAVDQKVFENLVKNSTLYDAFKAAGFENIDEVLKRIKEKEDTIQNLNKDLADTETKLGTCLTTAQELNEQDKETSGQLIDLQKQVKPLQDAILALQKELDVSTVGEIVPAIKTLKKSKVKQAPLPEGFINKLIFLFRR